MRNPRSPAYIFVRRGLTKGSPALGSVCRADEQVSVKILIAACCYCETIEICSLAVLVDQVSIGACSGRLTVFHLAGIGRGYGTASNWVPRRAGIFDFGVVSHDQFPTVAVVVSMWTWTGTFWEFGVNCASNNCAVIRTWPRWGIVMVRSGNA